MPADIAGEHRGSTTFEHMQLLRAGQRGNVVYSDFLFIVDSDEFACWNGCSVGADGRVSRSSQAEFDRSGKTILFIFERNDEGCRAP
jgi:hypothetical protein